MKKLFRTYNSEINKEELKIIAIKFKILIFKIRFLITINAFEIDINNLNIYLII